MDEQKPGDIISPRSSQGDPSAEVSVQISRDNPPAVPDKPAQPAAEPAPVETAEPAIAPVEAQPTPPSEAAPLSPGLVPESAPDAQAYQYSAAPEDMPPPVSDHVSWTASEFIEHAKSLNWYLVLGIAGLLGSIVVYFLTKDIVSTVVIAVVALLFGVYAATSKPRVLPYEISANGIQIGPKLYMYADFKTFSLLHEGNAFSKVELMPLKRFAPSVSMYFPPEEEEKIVRTLSEYLPYEDRKPDATDRLLNKLRF